MERIVFFTKYDRLGASSRLRTYQYIDFLQEELPNKIIAPLFSDKYLEKLYSRQKVSIIYIVWRYLNRFLFLIFALRRTDKIYIEKELFPYFPSIFEYCLKGRYIVDYDDAIHHHYDQSKNILIRTLFRNKISSVMKYSGSVVSGNTYLKKYSEKSGAKKTILLPTVVSSKKYDEFNKKDGGLITLGWIGTPQTQKYIVEIFPVFENLKEKANFELVLIGANPDLVPSYNFNLKIIQWTEETEVTSLSKIDIGLMPLPNMPQQRGKSGYKLIQYMALKKPVIASAVGANIDIVKHSETGFLIDSEQHWERYLIELIESEDLRALFGHAGHRRFLDNYSLEANSTHFLNLFS